MRPALLSLLLASAVCALADTASDLTVTVNKSIVLDHPAIRRLAITNPEIAEAVAVNTKEILLNGKNPGDTTLMLWDSKGVRSSYEVHVLANTNMLEAIRGELATELGPDVSLSVEGKNVFLRGTVSDPIAADRASSIAASVGKVVNLLRVATPAADPQILLKVRFANVSRNASQQLGTSFSIGDTNGRFSTSLNNSAAQVATSGTLSDLISILYSNSHFNINAAIQALESKSLLEVLAEPNLLTVSGKAASFLAGGEFPFPTIQGGSAGVGQITVQFKEFGIKLNFLPTVTPRGTIRMTVTPEVSSLDYSNGLVVNGFTVPGLATRRVQTEVELESGQSFVIAGLLNNQVQEQLNKIPGLGDVPVLGKLFRSRSITKNNSELLVMVTPELVRPLPQGVAGPSIDLPVPYMKSKSTMVPEQPGPAVTGAVLPLLRVDTMPIELFKTDTPSAPVVPQMSVPLGIPMLQPPPPSSGSNAAAASASAAATPTVKP